MKHLGDITKISGYDAPVVDVIVGGSPCQDLSVAGLRKGLAGERSGLFMEQIRVMKEMRKRDGLCGRTDQLIRPRYGVWENVPGALSSGTPKGGDFAAVLTEFVRVAEPEAPDVDVPEKGWPTSGCLIDEMGKWSVAWRILDGQHWGNAYRTDDGDLLKPGTPQRRRRIALVADLGGTSAPEILFERTGLRGDHPQSGAEGEGVAAYAQDCPGADDRKGESAVPCTLKIRSGCEGGGKGALVQEDKSATLATNNDQYLFQPICMATQQGGAEIRTDDKAPTITAAAGMSGNNQPVVCYPNVTDQHILDDQGGSQISVRTDGKSPTLRAEMHGNIPAVLQSAGFKAGNGAKVNGIGWEEEVAPTLASSPSGTNQVPAVVYRKGTRPRNAEEPQKWEEAEVANTLNAFDTGETRANELICCTMGNGQVNQSVSVEKAGTLNCMHDQQIVFCPDIAHTLRAKSNCDFREDSETYVVAGLDCRNGRENGDLCGTLQSNPNGGFSYNCIHPVRIDHIVRRLTPMECERLQGYPDGWTDIGDWTDSKGKTHKAADSPRYKALGNSICLPPWKWVLKRLCAHYERDATMASLFDGIGGFPLIWEQLNGKGTCLWASEIEEFPMAVTKRRFGDAR